MTPDRQRATEDHRRAEGDHKRAAKEHRRVERLNAFRTSPAGVALFYGYLFAIVVTAIFVGSVMLGNRHTAQRALAASARATRALCNQTKAAQERKATSAQFLKEHPHGTPDFSRALIERSIRAAQAEIDANKDIECKP
jgi:hypothetical protein